MKFQFLVPFPRSTKTLGVDRIQLYQSEGIVGYLFCVPWFSRLSRPRGKKSRELSPIMDGQKQGNRLTRRPCKGDELEILIFEAKRQMLVYAGVVKKCLQHGHSFRLASVWLKSENLRFACAVTRFCSSRVKKIGNPWFSIVRIISGRHTHPVFSSSRRFSTRALVATQKPETATRQHCDAMSSCRSKCIFLYTCWFFFVEHRHRSPFSEVFPCSIYLLSTSKQWFYRIYSTNDLENDKS